MPPPISMRSAECSTSYSPNGLFSAVPCPWARSSTTISMSRRSRWRASPPPSTRSSCARWPRNPPPALPAPLNSPSNSPGPPRARSARTGSPGPESRCGWTTRCDTSRWANRPGRMRASRDRRHRNPGSHSNPSSHNNPSKPGCRHPGPSHRNRGPRARSLSRDGPGPNRPRHTSPHAASRATALPTPAPGPIIGCRRRRTHHRPGRPAGTRPRTTTSSRWRGGRGRHTPRRDAPVRTGGRPTRSSPAPGRAPGRPDRRVCSYPALRSHPRDPVRGGRTSGGGRPVGYGSSPGSRSQRSSR